MKTKNKILLGLAASSGVVASFGATFALYQNTDKASAFNIGIGTVKTITGSNDELKYKFGEIKAFSDESLATSINTLSTFKFKPQGEGDTAAQDKLYLKVPLSFENPSERSDKNSANQKYAVGTLKVKVDVNSEIAKAGNVAVSAKLQGYDKAKGSASETYFTKHKSDDFFVTNTGTKDTFAEAANSVTHYIDTAIDQNNIYCVIGLDLSKTIDKDNFINLGSLSNAFTITLDWGEYDTSITANGIAGRDKADLDSKLNPDLWITGDKNGWVNDKINNDYQLVPNLAAEYYEESGDAKVEWTYAGLTTFGKLKVYDNTLDENAKWISCRNPTTKQTNNPGVKSESDGNAVLTIQDGYAYDVFYKRGAESTSEKGFWVSGSGTNNKISS